nr:MAG TPA: hypothetical protein [Caudoviricetes sp.]DAX10357.1 MAG TPA: hypothetical protein [Bacteriophage sp.]
MRSSSNEKRKQYILGFCGIFLHRSANSCFYGI